MTDELVYDNYEISGYRRLDRNEFPHRHGKSIEPCGDAQAHFWTLHGHIDGQGVESVGDFASRQEAEQVFRRITGQPFTGSFEAASRLRLMHASDQLLAACQMVVERWEGGELAEAARACQDAVTEATTACPPWKAADIDIHAVLAARQQIADVWSVEDVQSIRPDLDDKQAWEVLRATQRHHDASIGVNWDVLACHAEMLHGFGPDGDDDADEEV